MTEINIESDEIELQPIDDDSTLFSDNEQIPVEHVNFEFEQINKLRGIYRQITVFNDTHCYQSIKNKHQRKYKYRLNLVYLDPRPFRSRHIAWRWLHGSLALWGVDTALVFSGLLEGASVIALGLFICSTAVALMTLLAFFYFTHDTVYFRSQFGKIRLMELINNNPDKEKFQDFVNKLVIQINKSKTDSGKDNSQLLAQELQQLRRLKDETVIDEDAYEGAKKLIFRHDAFKASS
jgi:hypothetical protein